MSDSLDKKKYLALILAILLIGLALFTVWSKGPEANRVEVIPPTSTAIKPTATVLSTETEIPIATSTIAPTGTATPTQLPPSVTPVPTSTPEPTVTILLDGVLSLDTHMIEGLIHEIYINMSKQITVEVKEEAHGVIHFSGEPPWIDVSGTISPTGAVKVDGIGVVAGYPDVTVYVTGTFATDYFTGYLTMGGERELPGGEAGVYLVQGPYEAHPHIPALTPWPEIDNGASPTVTFGIFIEGFNYAMQNGSTAWLYDHLHPAVFERYDHDACLRYLDRTVQPEFEIKVQDFTGPEVWMWELEGVAIEIDNAYTADSELTIKGNVNQTDVHFAIVNGQFKWFTTCVNPEE